MTLFSNESSSIGIVERTREGILQYTFDNFKLHQCLQDTDECRENFSYRSNSSLQISSLLGIHFHGQDESSTRMSLWKRLIKGTFDGVSLKARNLQP